MAGRAGLGLEPRRLALADLVAVGAGQPRRIDVQGVVKWPARAGHGASLDAGVAGEAPGRRAGVLVVAGFAPRGVEAHHLARGALGVRAMTGLAVDLRRDDVGRVDEGAAELGAALVLDRLVTREAGRVVGRLAPGRG